MEILLEAGAQPRALCCPGEPQQDVAAAEPPSPQLWAPLLQVKRGWSWGCAVAAAAQWLRVPLLLIQISMEINTRVMVLV